MKSLPDDAWYEAETPLRRELVGELRRLLRRARARWLVWLVVCLGLTAAAGAKLARKEPLKTATVTLSVHEGELGGNTSVLADLQHHIANVLLTDAAVLEIVQRRDLYPLRKKLGDQFAIQELRDQLEVEVARNYFVFEYSHNAHRSSARVDVSILDTDGVLAFELAHDVAAAIIATADSQRQAAREALERQTGVRVDALRARLSELAYDIADAAYAIDHPGEDVSKARLAMMREDLAVLHAQQRAATSDLELLVAAASADQIAVAQGDAGVGLSLAVVSETRPEEGDPGRNLRIATTIVILGLVIGLAVALVLAAFDDKVRDPEDIARAGLRVVGHLPAFPGDDVGALVDRGIPVGSTRPRSGVRV